MKQKSILDNLIGPQKKHQSSEVILDHAHKKAEKIITEATIKASDLLAQSELLNENLKKQIEVEMMRAVSENAEFIKTQTKLTLDVTLEEFKALIKSSITDMQTTLRQKIDEQFELTKKDIDLYKAERLKKIDEHIVRRIDEMAKELLGEIITPTDHRQLVIKALEKAKKDGLFSN